MSLSLTQIVSEFIMFSLQKACLVYKPLSVGFPYTAQGASKNQLHGTATEEADESYCLEFSEENLIGET